MNTTQLVIILATLGIFALLGFAMSKSIKQYESSKHKVKKKKGKNKYMPQAKNPGK